MLALVAQGYTKSRPDAVTLTAVISIHASRGEVTEALALFRSLAAPLRDGHLYVAMLSALEKSSLNNPAAANESLALFKELLETLLPSSGHGKDDEKEKEKEEGSSKQGSGRQRRDRDRASASLALSRALSSVYSTLGKSGRAEEAWNLHLWLQTRLASQDQSPGRHDDTGDEPLVHVGQAICADKTSALALLGVLQRTGLHKEASQLRNSLSSLPHLSTEPQQSQPNQQRGYQMVSGKEHGKGGCLSEGGPTNTRWGELGSSATRSKASSTSVPFATLIAQARRSGDYRAGEYLYIYIYIYYNIPV
jgi:hypothetical protein